MSSHENTEIEFKQNGLELSWLAVPLAIAVLVLLLPVFILDKVTQQPIRNRNAKFTKWLMFGVISSNTLYQIIHLIRLLICAQCRIIISSYGCSRSLLKCVNLLFLVHRAKLVQGITPVLGQKWFEKIFPAVIIVGSSGFIFLNIIDNKPYECASYDGWDGLRYCRREGGMEGGDDGFKAGIAFAIELDTLVTAILMMLFIIPLYRVYNVDLGVMSSCQLDQRKKLKHLLIWSIGLTFINQVTSTLVLAPYLDGGTPHIF